MIPTKYPKRTDGEHADITDGLNPFNTRELFDWGAARSHSKYMIEMSFKHPVMYLLWYRWWIPSRLHEDEQKQLKRYRTYAEIHEYRPYWAEFSLHHPVLFFLYLLFQGLVQNLTALIKVICGVFKSPVTSEKADNILVKDEFIEQKGDVP